MLACPLLPTTTDYDIIHIHYARHLSACRLVVLEASHALDRVGNKAARGQIAAAKALAPSAVLAILDRAIQASERAGAALCCAVQCIAVEGVQSWAAYWGIAGFRFFC
jgi:hypothetical protein